MDQIPGPLFAVPRCLSSSSVFVRQLHMFTRLQAARIEQLSLLSVIRTLDDERGYYSSAGLVHTTLITYRGVRLSDVYQRARVD